MPRRSRSIARTWGARAHPNYPAGFFVFDPIDPNMIYANAGVLYRSADKGASLRVCANTVRAMK
jgi:hypothetical protein